MNDGEFYWDWLKHEAEILTNRGNLFLVAESMLIVAFTTLAIADPTRGPVVVVLCLAGLFVTGIWFTVNLKHVYRTIPLIQEALEKADPRWKEIRLKRSDLPSNARLLGIKIPLGLLVVWAVLIGLTLR